MLAMASAQPIHTLTDPPLSPASRLLQGKCVCIRNAYVQQWERACSRKFSGQRVHSDSPRYRWRPSPASWLLQGKCICIWINTIDCRSRLAGEKCLGNTFIQTARVIVGVHRQQAGSYRGMRTSKETGRLAGRLAFALLWFLILICPVGRPSGGSAQWATRHGCRVSRPRPWMADGGGPTEQDRSEGMASLSEPPYVRGAGAWLLGAFPSNPL